MKYMLLVYGDEKAYTPEEHARCREESSQLCRELHAQGKFIDASPLHPVSTATCLRVRDGKRSITDGPFVEMREQLGGFYLIDVDNLDEAIAFAGKLPPAKKGTIEIRPVFEMANLLEPAKA